VHIVPAVLAVSALTLLSAASTHAGRVVGPIPGRPDLRPIVVSNNGEKPSVAVDEEGTAHVVWNEHVNGGADILHYCRILRGTRTCQSDQRFVPPEDNPQYNTDTTGPRVAITGAGEVVLLTFRYPNVVWVNSQGSPVPNCDNYPPSACQGRSSKVWTYRSEDGGASFGPPHIFGHAQISGDAITLNSPEAVPPGTGEPGGTESLPLVATISGRSDGVNFQSAPPEGYAQTAADLGNEGSSRSYEGTLAALNDDTPVAAFTDLNPTIYLRWYGGFGPRNDVRNWKPAVAIDRGEFPRLGGGPAGVFLAYKPGLSSNVTQIVMRRFDGKSVSAARIVSDGGNVVNDDVFEDQSGRVHVAWVRRNADGEELRYRSSTDGGQNFTDGYAMARAGASSISNVELAAAEDGGGFAVFSSSLSGPGTITVVPFGNQSKRFLIDARATAVEVTQGIQQMTIPTRSPNGLQGALTYQGVGLAEGRTTVVRIYANLRKALPPAVLRGGLAGRGQAAPAMTLRGFRDGKPLGGGALLPDAYPTPLPVGRPDEVTAAQRNSPRGAYTFSLPWQWAYGNVTLVAEINPQGLTPALAECRLCRFDNVIRLGGLHFQPTTRVRIRPVEIQIGGTRPAGAPNFEPVFAGVRAVTPFPFDIGPWPAPIIDVGDWARATTITTEKCFLGIFPCSTSTQSITQQQKDSMSRQRLVDWVDENAHDKFLFPVGVYPTNGGLGGGLTGGGPDGGGFLYGEAEPVAIVDGGRQISSVGHEIHHGIGRVHADVNCGGNSNGQRGENLNGNDGALDGIGLDMRTPVPYQLIVPTTPPSIWDLMSYCPASAPVAGTVAQQNAQLEARNWITTTNWNRALNFRQPLAARETVQRAVRRIASAHPAAARSLRLTATVDKTGAVIVGNVAPDDGAPTPVTSGHFRLVARDKAGKELATAGAVVSLDHDHSGPLATLTGRVPAGRTAAIDVVQDGNPVAQRLASKHAPSVRILAPRRGARVGGSGTVEVRWEATDADHDRLVTSVEYSAGGNRFRTLQIGPSRGLVRLPAVMFAASRHARVRVRAQDGFHETVATSGSFISRGAPPYVSIQQPLRRTRVVAGAALLLQGFAFDDAGQAVTGRRLAWRDGRRVVGHGDRATEMALAPGTHRITLEARDRLGRRGRATVVVRVDGSLPRFTILHAPKRVRRTARRVTLTVATTFAATLRIGKASYPVGPQRKKVRVRIKPGRKQLQLKLRLVSGRQAVTVPLVIPRR
jgi:hypothetical protein